MAIAFTTLPTGYTTWRAADSPCLIAQRVVSPTTRWTKSRDFAATDFTVAAAPRSRAHDGFVNLPTYPDNGTPPATWHYLIDLGTTKEINAIAILGHNLASCGLTNLRLRGDDVSNFAAVTTMHTFGVPADNNRLVAISLNGLNRHFTGVRYMTIEMDGTFPVAPQLGEVLIGAQYQLRLKPDNPFDPTRRAREISQSVSAGGLRQTVIHHRNRFDLDANFHLWETDRIADVTNFVNETRGNFGWIWQPNTDVTAMHWMTCDGSGLSLPSEGYTERNWNLTAQEQGPESYFLASET